MGMISQRQQKLAVGCFNALAFKSLVKRHHTLIREMLTNGQI